MPILMFIFSIMLFVVQCSGDAVIDDDDYGDNDNNDACIGKCWAGHRCYLFSIFLCPYFVYVLDYFRINSCHVTLLVVRCWLFWVVAVVSFLFLRSVNPSVGFIHLTAKTQNTVCRFWCWFPLINCVAIAYWYRSNKQPINQFLQSFIGVSDCSSVNRNDSSFSFFELI